MAKKIGGLRISSLSPSAIAAWNQCMLKYYYRYHTKEKGVSDSLALRYGSAVHSSMEKLGKRLMQGELLTPQLCEEVAQSFVQEAARFRISDLVLIEEAQQFIRDRIYKHNPNYRVVGVELRLKNFGITTDKGVPLNGIIDLALEMSSDASIILDYKTSRVAQTITEAKTDIQLSMYDLMYSKIKPQYKKIWLALDYLRSEVVVSERTLDERLAFEQWVNALWQVMGDTTEKDVESSVNEYCAWCDYRHLCTDYKLMLEKGFEIKPISVLADQKEFVDEWQKIKTLEKTAKQRLNELKTWANNKVSMEGRVQFEGEKKIVSWAQGKRTFYDARAVISAVPVQDLFKVVSVKNDAIKKYINTERPDLRAAIEAAERISPGAPRMTIKGK